MSLNGSILNRLPDPIPKSAIRVETTITVATDSNGNTVVTYPLPKSPFEQLQAVEAVIDGVQTELAVGDEVVAVDTNGDGEVDSIEFTSVTPDADTDVTVVYDTVPTIVEYTGAYDDDVAAIGAQLDTVIENKSVDEATGQSLDLVGTQFGALGSRSGRGDSVYRSYLRSLVPTFTATGTRPDVKIAVSAATGVATDEIEITEDTNQVGFYVIISSADVVTASAELSDIIDLASPSGVELLNDPIVRSELLFATVNFNQYTVTTNDGLGTGTLGGGTLGSRAGVTGHLDS